MRSRIVSVHGDWLRINATHAGEKLTLLEIHAEPPPGIRVYFDFGGWVAGSYTEPVMETVGPIIGKTLEDLQQKITGWERP